ncbi:hypothetical protein WME76_21765 [Sorangium sp. So ce119]|uniref:hypothetical protein n=1 Tax=Sorangium sp. So ce119 TaxID=3133279 RepID=UPI003F602249
MSVARSTPEVDVAPRHGGPLAEALAKLDEAMRPPRASSVDPERRRVAARLADLVRCEDDELPAFARRHLPGRTVEEPALRDARELLLAIGRVLGPEAESAEALGVLQDVHRALEERLEHARQAAARREAEAASAEEAAAEEAAAEEAAAAEASAPALLGSLAETSVPALLGSLAEASAPALLGSLAEASAPALLGSLAETSAPALLGSLAETSAPALAGSLVETSVPALVGSLAPLSRPGGVLPFVSAPALAPTPVTTAAPGVAAPACGEPVSMRSPPPLTLNQYAGLVVACELYPAYVESTHARYGVPTPAARAALDAFWAARLATDPALAQRWPELCEAARRYFLESR